MGSGARWGLRSHMPAAENLGELLILSVPQSPILGITMVLASQGRCEG